jgi:hypothetical protein
MLWCKEVFEKYYSTKAGQIITLAESESNKWREPEYCETQS